ncbi:MAG TPA: GntR family transcriptional regulator [Candidatus Sulfomarinibacteraceae bacterium]|nr:GntR family transcriptional regulator [Candidatus Sulfomarinibacteraceae bacterium]
MTTLRSAQSRRITLTEAAYRELRGAILDGKYRPGGQLPTEAELGAMLKVSRTVVREALRTLEEDGLITRRHGVGTFVRKHLLLKNLNFNFGITEMVTSAGLTPGASCLYAYCQEARELDDEIRIQLRLEEKAEVLVIERARTADGQPVVYTIDTIPKKLFGNAPLDPQRLRDESLYHILRHEYGITIDYGVARILPIFSPRRVQERLSLPEESLMLYVKQTDYNANDDPLLFERVYHLPDFFDFIIWRRGNIRFSSGEATAGA